MVLLDIYIIVGFHISLFCSFDLAEVTIWVVSWNRGIPPNHPFLDGSSSINEPFWGSPISGNHQMVLEIHILRCLRSPRGQIGGLFQVGDEDGKKLKTRRMVTLGVKWTGSGIWGYQKIAEWFMREISCTNGWFSGTRCSTISGGS